MVLPRFIVFAIAGMWSQHALAICEEYAVNTAHQNFMNNSFYTVAINPNEYNKLHGVSSLEDEIKASRLAGNIEMAERRSAYFGKCWPTRIVKKPIPTPRRSPMHQVLRRGPTSMLQTPIKPAMARTRRRPVLQARPAGKIPSPIPRPSTPAWQSSPIPRSATRLKCRTGALSASGSPIAWKASSARQGNAWTTARAASGKRRRFRRAARTYTHSTDSASTRYSSRVPPLTTCRAAASSTPVAGLRGVARRTANPADVPMSMGLWRRHRGNHETDPFPEFYGDHS